MELDFTSLEEIRNGLPDLIQNRKLRQAHDLILKLEPSDIAEVIKSVEPRRQALIFRIIPRDLTTRVFEYLEFDTQQDLLSSIGAKRVAWILNEMSADDRTALLERLPEYTVSNFLRLLSPDERRIAQELLGYPEDSIGRIMTPDFLAVREDWTVSQVLDFVRRHGNDSETLNVVYAVDSKQRLIDDIKIREFLVRPLSMKVSELCDHSVVALNVLDDKETAVDTFKKYDRGVLPVVDPKNILVGIVTSDDVLDIAEQESTEDIQKIGGMEALDEPYLNTSLFSLVKKRAIWLVLLLVGEMFTAIPMTIFEHEIQRAVVLALFVPLIISSGGNSGSQATTLIIRALAIGEITLKDWGRVFFRELASGALLGLILGACGFLRVIIASKVFDVYGDQYLQIAATVGTSLVGVVIWGCITGAMLPFLLKKMGADPATSSAPFVATIVDVTGLVLYFSFAMIFLNSMF